MIRKTLHNGIQDVAQCVAQHAVMQTLVDAGSCARHCVHMVGQLALRARLRGVYRAMARGVGKSRNRG